MKGITRFELTNVKTGEVEVYEEQNMFTNALASVFNNPPFFFNNLLMAQQKQANGDEAFLTPVYNHALGGLLLFPEVIEENANTLYAPADNAPVGIGSNDGYSGTDFRRGNFNGKSGPIKKNGKTIGFSYIWDFPTSAGNGKISCACLTSVLGGAGYLESNNVILHKSLFQSWEGTTGFVRSNVNDPWTSDTDRAPRGFVFGAHQKGIIFRRDNGTICRNTTNLDSPGLFENPNEYDTLFSLANNGACVVVGDDIWCVRTNGNSSGNATVNIDKYIEANDWQMETETITVSAPLKKTEYYYTCAVIANYLYMCGYGDDGVYKINLDNLADVTKIEVSVPSSCLYPFGDLVSSKECFIDTEDHVHMTGIEAVPCYRYGTWAVLSQRVHGGKICFFSASVFMPYLATINNLKNVINKTPDKTMTVTYNVYE